MKSMAWLAWYGGEWEYRVLSEEPTRRHPLGSTQRAFLESCYGATGNISYFQKWWVSKSVDTAIAHHNWAALHGDECRPGCPVPTDVVLVFEHSVWGSFWRIITMTPSQVMGEYYGVKAQHIVDKLLVHGCLELVNEDGRLIARVPSGRSIMAVELGNRAMNSMTSNWVNSYCRQYEKVISSGPPAQVGLELVYSPASLQFQTHLVSADYEDKFARHLEEPTWDPPLNDYEFATFDKSGRILTFMDRKEYLTFVAVRWLTSVATPPPQDGELFVGSFYGGRVFILDGDVVTGITGTPWPGPVLDAECLYKSHDAPDEDCSCGIYLVSDDRTLFKEAFLLIGRSRASALALVKAYGKLAVGSRGYRAQRVEVLLFVSDEREPLLKFDVPIVSLQEAFELDKLGITPLEYLERGGEWE